MGISMKKVFIIMVFALSVTQVFAGVSGKIAGKITNTETGMPLIGANVVISGTSMGAASNINGYYSILNVTPGTYNLKISMIGYATKMVMDVRVEIDLTASIDITMDSEALEGETVVVLAQQKVVRVDVAASQKSISSKDIAKLPVSSVSSILSLQAGVSGFSIRGGNTNETMFMVDGIVLNDERTGEPTTGIPLSAIQDVSVQTGGFSAEYSNVRSGVVNVVTKEGSPDKYSGTIMYRQSPSGQKHFGQSPYDENSFWLRPYLDDEVCWDGTYSGAWDKYTQRQYPSFDGWNSVSEQTLSNEDPSDDLTASGAQKLFTWQHRKNGAIAEADYTIDAGFGGPVPFISNKLGNLRFFASILSKQNMYLYHITTPGVENTSTFFRLTSDLSKNKKLTFSHLQGTMDATTSSRSGLGTIMSSTYQLASQVNRSGFTMPWRIFTNDYWSPTSVNNSTYALKYTHQINSATFYEVLAKIDDKQYHTWHGPKRDSTLLLIFGEEENGWYANNAPYGFQGSPESSIEGTLNFGGAISTSRDTSRVKTFTLKVDYLAQLNQFNQFKTGFEFISTKLNLEYGSRNEFLPDGNYWTTIDKNPYRLSTYAQNKMEFKGFVGMAGLVIDYVNPNSKWYEVDTYDEDFYSSNYSEEIDNQFDKKSIKPELAFSPRLSISHPITNVSKLYFNYGHYRQLPIAQELFRIRRGNSNEVKTIGDPELPLAKTISYELGYDHALDEKYLIHVSAYYKDISDQQDYTHYFSANDKVIYYQLTANSYEDIRGIELELSKLRGKWITGNINFEYRVNTSGYFGVKEYHENPSEQRDFLLRSPQQSKPRPIPRVKSVVDFHTPLNFGPKLVNNYLFGDWHLNLISRWNKGGWFTYNPNKVSGIKYNFQYKDNKNFDIKLSKTLKIKNINVKFYGDIYNVLNIKNFSGYGFEDKYDYDDYMQSLHLPEKTVSDLGYHYFSGEDQPGDVRPENIDFVPIEWSSAIEYEDDPSSVAIYYDNTSETYVQYDEIEGWSEVDQDYFDWVINNKAYIDMPNIEHFVFLNPRDIYFGINISYDF